jgi:hypothetical protein
LPVVASLVPIGTRPGAVRLEAWLVWDGPSSRFATELPGHAPGLYELRAREVPGAGTVETIEVVDGDRLG